MERIARIVRRRRGQGARDQALQVVGGGRGAPRQRGPALPRQAGVSGEVSGCGGARSSRFARRRSGRRAARGARAGRADAPRRRPHDRSRGRSGISGPLRAFLQGWRLGWTIGRNVRSTPAGPRPMAPRFAGTRRNWPRSRRTSSWPLPPRLGGATGDPHRPDRVPGVVDPVGAGVVDEPGAAGRQRHRVHELRRQHRWEWLELLEEISRRREARRGAWDGIDPYAATLREP